MSSVKKTEVRIKRRLKSVIHQFYSLSNKYPKEGYISRTNRLLVPGKNFGDMLTPDILQYFGVKPLYTPEFEKCDVLCVGSILDIVPESYCGSMLGTGFIYESAKRQFPFANITLVREKLTAAKLNIPKSFPVGDPGILVGEVYGK